MIEDDLDLEGSENSKKGDSRKANDTSDNNESVEKFESILSILLQTLTELIKESQSKIQPKVKLDVKETKSTGGIR